MARYSYPTIKVSGMGNLKIYGLDYSAPTVDSPGKMSVTYIDKNNSLNPPKLTTKTASIITIGGLIFKGYPTKSSKILSASGENLLEVSYTDGSFILDQYYVGLNGKHANSSTSFQQLYSNQNFNNEGLIFKSLRSYVNHTKNGGKSSSLDVPQWMILVGQSIDPCLDSFENESIEDPCNPCPQSSNSQARDSSDIDCQKKRSYEIFDVDYSFDELLSALKNKSLKVSINGDYNKQYRANYSGSLREVLKTWCSLFGFSFYYDNDTIKIYDLSTGVTSLPTLSESIVLSKREESSIEHTNTTAGILYHAQPGVDRDYNCSSDYGKKILCRPLTVNDLGVKALMSDYGATSSTGFNELIEYLSTFSSYSPVLREMIAWFEIYGIRSSGDAKTLIAQKRNSSGALGKVKYGGYHTMSLTDDKNGEYSLPLLSMTLKAVYDSSSPEFNELVSNNSPLDDSFKARALDSKYKPYFFVASQNESRYANMVNWENSIGSNFLGKYFIRWYENYSSSSPTIQACQNDQATFYKQGSSSLNFANFIPLFDTSESPEFGYDPSKYKRAANYTSLPIYKFNSNQGTVKDSFILVQRDVRWNPPQGEGGAIKNILNAAEPFRPIQLGPVSGFGNFINSHPSAKNAPFSDKDMLYIGFAMPSGFNTSVTSVNHPDDESFGKRCEVYLSPFSTPIDLGLKSKRCKKISLGNIGEIYMPPQASYSGSDGGYGIYVSHERSIDYKKVVPKLEVVASNFINNADVLSNNVNHKTSVNLTSVNTLKYTKNGDGSETCLPNHADIQSRMNELVKNMASSSIGPSKTITYEIGGLPLTNYTITNGLINLSVRVGSKGVSSTLTFSDLKERVISVSETLSEFESIKNSNISNNFNSSRIGKNFLSRDIESNTLKL